MVAFSAPLGPKPTTGSGAGRSAYSSPQAQAHISAPRQPPTYTPGPGPTAPKSGILGMFAPPSDPQKFGPRKTILRQSLGSLINRRGAGISQITGGDQDLHSVGRYGKKAPGGGGLGGMGDGGTGGGGLFGP